MAKRKEHLVCFAYGSNMLSIRMRAPNRVPSARPIGIAYLSGYRLTFDKVSQDDSGKCDAHATDNDEDRVYGVLYAVAKNEKSQLDRAEGLGNGYEEKTVEVRTGRGKHSALLYYATKKDAARKPYHWYKAFVVAGAVEHQLPFAYTEWLRTIEAIQDPDESRRLENERLLAQQQLPRRIPTRPRAKTGAGKRRKP
jgi:hypothetical protein